MPKANQKTFGLEWVRGENGRGRERDRGGKEGVIDRGERKKERGERETK